MNVTELERQPRAKINEHLDTHKILVLGTYKLIVFFSRLIRLKFEFNQRSKAFFINFIS